MNTVTESPLVSVIIGTYNRASVIRQTLESVFAQTYPNVEIVIVDDNSYDGTLEILRSYGDRIRLIERLENSGSADIPRYEAMEVCKGTYAAFLDSDDAWDERKLERQVGLMEADPSIGLSHHYLRKVLPDGEELEIRHENRLPATGQVAEALLDHCFISTSSVMVRPPLWLSAQKKEALTGFGTEWDFFLSIAREHPVGLVDEVLGYYRVDPESVSHRSWKRGPWDVTAMERLYRKGLHQGLIPDRVMRKKIAKAGLENSVHYRERNQPERSFWFWKKSLKYHPFGIGTWMESIKMVFRVLCPYPAYKVMPCL